MEAASSPSTVDTTLMEKSRSPSADAADTDLETLSDSETMTSHVRKSSLRSPPASGMMRKSVSFSNVHIYEHNITLGDHPSTIQGPAVTLEWDAIDSHILTVDQFESANVEGTIQRERRKHAELKIPAMIRREMLKGTHSTKDMDLAMALQRKVQHQRQVSLALQEVEGLEILWQSTVRKLRRWTRKPDFNDPAAVWLKEHPDLKNRRRASDPGKKLASCPEGDEPKRRATTLH